MDLQKQKWNADEYANNSTAQLKWAEELIAKLALKGDESILDIGCGDGKISARLAQIVRNGRVLGIDSSESMINHASEQFPARTFPNLRFQIMDAAAIRLSEKFDLVFSNAALHWVEDHMAVLRGVHSCLKPNGKILFQMGGSGNADSLFKVAGEIMELPRWRDYYRNFKSPYHFYSPEQYRIWLEKSKFKALRVELIPKDMQQKGKEGVKGWLRTTWFPYLDRLPCEKRELFLDEVVEKYLSGYPIDADGHIHIGMVRLEVEACPIS